MRGFIASLTGFFFFSKPPKGELTSWLLKRHVLTKDGVVSQAFKACAPPRVSIRLSHCPDALFAAVVPRSIRAVSTNKK